MSSETVSTRHSPRTAMSAMPMNSTSNQPRRHENGHHWDKSTPSNIGGTHVIDDESNNQTSDQKNSKDSGTNDTKHAISSRRGSSNSPYQSSQGSRTSSDDDTAERERVSRQSTREPSSTVSNVTLPSLSRTTPSLPTRSGSNDRTKSQSAESQYPTGNGDGLSQRLRSRSGERVENNNAENRWSNSTSNKDDGVHTNADERSLRYTSGKESRQEASPTSPNGPNGQEDVRIMFHGREIYADDLVGLRVAKTFVGHGRFLGQVVKFDDTTALYTVVYADGDAEELSIDNTIRILIQDEIERADPVLPPVASSNSFERGRMVGMDSPDVTATHVSSTITSTSLAPINPAAPPASSQYTRPSSTPLNISAREAQFVVGLFENHALPVLLRQGWRVQSNSTGGEQLYWAPPGNFRGAGQIFTSALDVVELIASDSETLSLCFPSNVHSAILSLFPDIQGSLTSASRKRLPSGSMDVEMAYDTKRVRPERDEVVYGSISNIRGGGVGMVRTGLTSRPTRDSVDQRLVPPVSYRAESERDMYGPSGRINALLPSDRQGGVSRSARARPDHSRGISSLHDPEYRRLQGGMYHSAPLHPLATPESGHGPRWPVVKQIEGDNEYHSSYGERVGEWDERGPRETGYIADRVPSSRIPIHHTTNEYDYHPTNDRLSYSREGSHGGTVQGPVAGEVETPQSYRYRGVRSHVPGGGQFSPHTDLFLHRHPADRDSRSLSSPPDFQSGHPPSSTERFSRPLSRASSNNGILPSVRPASGERNGPSSGGRGFSMMDVDRANGSRSSQSGYERGRSPNMYSQYLGGKRRGTNADSPDTLIPDIRSGSNNKTSNAIDESRVI